MDELKWWEIIFRNLTIDQYLELVQELGNYFEAGLKRWHFFLEGPYTVVRVELSTSYDYFHELIDYIEEFMDKRIKSWKGTWEIEEGWNKECEIVEENKEYFATLFHINSKLFITETDPKKLARIIERLLHTSIYTLMNGVKNEYGDINPWMLEAHILTTHGIARAFYNGQVYQNMRNNEPRE